MFLLQVVNHQSSNSSFSLDLQKVSCCDANNKTLFFRWKVQLKLLKEPRWSVSALYSISTCFCNPPSKIHLAKCMQTMLFREHNFVRHLIPNGPTKRLRRRGTFYRSVEANRQQFTDTGVDSSLNTFLKNSHRQKLVF